MIIQSETNKGSSNQLSDHQRIPEYRYDDPRSDEIDEPTAITNSCPPESGAHDTLTTATSTNLIDHADSTMSKVDESLEIRDSYASVSCGITETSNVAIGIYPLNGTQECVSSLTTNEVAIQSRLVNFTFEISDSNNHQHYFRTKTTTMSILMKILFKMYQITMLIQVRKTSISNCHHVDFLVPSVRGKRRKGKRQTRVNSQVIKSKKTDRVHLNQMISNQYHDPISTRLRPR